MIWLVMSGLHLFADFLATTASFMAFGVVGGSYCLQSTQAFAAIEAPVPFQIRAASPVDRRSESAHSDLGTLDIEVLAPEGQSFNLKAPLVLEISPGTRTLGPREMGTHRVLFKLPGLQRRDFKVSLYVCVDATGDCHKRTAWGAWTGDSRNPLVVRY